MRSDPIKCLFHFYRRKPSSSSSPSETCSLFSSPHPSDSRPVPRIPKLPRKPMNATPPKTPKARASPFGLTYVATEKRLPERKGPAARPAEERVCASPLSVPNTEGVGAEFVI